MDVARSESCRLGSTIVVGNYILRKRNTDISRNIHFEGFLIRYNIHILQIQYKHLYLYVDTWTINYSWRTYDDTFDVLTLIDIMQIQKIFMSDLY